MEDSWPTRHKDVDRHISLTLTPGCWTYYSISDNLVVGTVAIGDAQADEAWAERTDWDIAFSEYGLRTNGGASGKGQGGLFALPTLHWDELETIPTDGYIPDMDSMQVFVPLSTDSLSTKD